MKVLIIEDDKLLLGAYKLKFGKSGYEVEYASDGSSAQKKFKEFSPDLVLLDLVLPQKDGFSLLQEFRSLNPKVPILVTSNLSQKEDIDRAKKLGANEYLIKSNYTVKQILEKIKKYIG